MKYLLLTFCLFFNIISAQDIIIPKKFSAKVIGISDGDTFKVLYKKQIVKIRLNHIDAPEKSQNFGKKAKEYASNLCFGKNVKITWKKKDRYQRILGEVFLNEININQEMVKAGYAWHFKQYSKDPIGKINIPLHHGIGEKTKKAVLKSRTAFLLLKIFITYFIRFI